MAVIGPKAERPKAGLSDLCRNIAAGEGAVVSITGTTQISGRDAREGDCSRLSPASAVWDILSDLEAVHDSMLSVVIPAFNEELYLPETLSRLRDAISACTCGVEIVVVDNQSGDRTADVARSFGATVIQEAVHNVARVRNAGANVARGDVLVFVDADTAVPRRFLERIAEAMTDSACMGGTADIVHSPTSSILIRWLSTKFHRRYTSNRLWPTTRSTGRTYPGKFQACVCQR